ncbi:hypothetical protein MLD38_026376 [Melastoma candidum]|uniref:Uncharacterized protein n=1 Tax=Melastoma candidum TaxID=119954 RepID=A0ACB9NYE1_9MYRT|nr:hypothetical protein MLD38_026376 [Melastoma candidum]
MSTSSKPLNNAAATTRNSIDAFTFHLHSWKPFHHPSEPPIPSPSSAAYKRPCLSDRLTTAFSLDMSRLTLVDDDRDRPPRQAAHGTLGFIAKKRRRRGSRSISGRSSDRSIGTTTAMRIGCCSDIGMAIGTDSSGEMFVDWGSDVSEARGNRKVAGGLERDKDRGECREKEEGLGGVGLGEGVSVSESGYGSEPGYRGDAEFGYGDEVDLDADEEEDDGVHKVLFWGDRFRADAGSKMEMVAENNFSDQKTHYRCRRKKHDNKMIETPR